MQLGDLGKTDVNMAHQRGPNCIAASLHLQQKLLKNRMCKRALRETGATFTRDGSEPDRIGFSLHGTGWNQSRCLHGTVLNRCATDQPRVGSAKRIQNRTCN